MVLAIAINAVLATIVFTGLMVMILRTIRTSDAAAPDLAPRVAPGRRQARSRRSARALIPARPWA